MDTTEAPASSVMKATVQPCIKFKGKSYPYDLDSGAPLKFDWHGSVPKKVLKKAIRMWRKLNPPRDDMSTAGATIRAVFRGTDPYHLNVLLLRLWLTEQSKKEIPA